MGQMDVSYVKASHSTLETQLYLCLVLVLLFRQRLLQFYLNLLDTSFILPLLLGHTLPRIPYKAHLCSRRQYMLYRPY